MKTFKTKIEGIEVTLECYNPVFKEVEVEGDVDVFTLVEKRIKDEILMVKQYEKTEKQKRTITLCHLAAPIGDTVTSSVGIAVMNPGDEACELGKTIAEGRALKTPINGVTMISARKLPKALVKEQLIWASKHVERNLNSYVNNIRETLKNE